MAYLQSIQSQILLCLRSVGFGFLLGIGYELVRFLRLLRAKRTQAAWDVVYGVLAGLCVFLFVLIYDDGRLRAYVLLAMSVGFAVFYRFCAAAMRHVFDRWLSSLRRVCAYAARPFRKIGSRTAALRRAGAAKIKNFSKKRQKNKKSS